MRSIWSGSINFGLINIPIKLYSATEDHALEFDILHKTDLSPIRYARICKEDGKEIPYKDIVKGYEYQKGEYIVINENDFKAAESEKNGMINIHHFVKHDEIDPIYFEKPYYLEPAKGADKPYALLREALSQSNKVAIVTYVFRNKEHLGILMPHEKAIVLNQMRFAHEIRDLSTLKLPEEANVNKKESEMSLKLVNQLTSKFQAEKYHDHYTEKLQKIIEAKIKGIPIEKKHIPSKKTSKIHDITSLLEASLKEFHASKKPKKKTKKRVG